MEHLITSWPSIVEALPLVAIFAFIPTLFTLFQLIPKRPYLKELGGDTPSDVRGIVCSQWALMRNAKYILRLPFRKIHVLPAELVNEYAWKPDAEISSNGDLQDRLLGRWSYIGSTTPDLADGPYDRAVQYTKSDLTKHMAVYLPYVHEEISNFLDKNIVSDSDWMSFKVQEFCISLCFKIYQRAFVGPELYENPEWKAACVGHSVSAVGVAGSLMQWPKFLRPIVAPFLQAPRDVKHHVAKMCELLEPVLKTRIQNLQIPGFEPPRDFIQWWLDRTSSKSADVYPIVMALIQLNFAGTRSTGVVVMQTLLDLAVHQEYISEMRAEVEAIVSAAGERLPSGASLTKMRKVDSFVKESQRHVPQNILSVYRKATKSLHLSDGTIIPADSYVCVPSMDPDSQGKTATRPFEGFRWASLRDEFPKNETKFLSVTSGPHSLEFGAGSHACPGRFIAMTVVKSVVAEVLLRYNIRIGPGQAPKPLEYNKALVLVPDAEQLVELKRRG